MHNVTTPKNIAMSLSDITFFKSMASGNDRPTTPIMKAIAVPKGMPFATNTCTTGSMPDAFEYIALPKWLQWVQQTDCLYPYIFRKTLLEYSHA